MMETSRINEINGSYFSWLKERVHAHIQEHKHYNYILKQLYMTKACVIVESDENWIEWGIFNRTLFQAAYPQYTEEELMEAIGYQCNMFELGYALAKYTNEQIIREEVFWDGTHEVFWEMMENIGLDIFTDRQVTLIPNGTQTVRLLIEKLNERRYEPDGTGNWFRLNQPREGQDLRLIDLLHQSWAYVNEGQGYRWI